MILVTLHLPSGLTGLVNPSHPLRLIRIRTVGRCDAGVREATVETSSGQGCQTIADLKSCLVLATIEGSMVLVILEGCQTG